MAMTRETFRRKLWRWITQEGMPAPIGVRHRRCRDCGARLKWAPSSSARFLRLRATTCHKCGRSQVDNADA